jgi:type IV pilus assembly protein PilA
LYKSILLRSVKKNTSEEGFTLVELLVVVVIIAVLAAIAIPIFLNQKTSAQDSAAKSELVSAAKYLRDGLALGVPIAEGNIPSTIQGVGSFEATVTTARIDPNNSIVFCLRTPSESGKVFYWESLKGYTENPSAYCSLGENLGGGGGDGGGGGGTPEPTPEETINDTNNGATILVYPDRTNITFAAANWEWMTITYLGENGSITNRIEKTGVSTDGPLVKNSNTQITINLPRSTQIALNVKYNGKSTGEVYNF